MHAIIKDGKAEYVHGAFVGTDGFQHPANVLKLWSEEELLAVGVHKIIADHPSDDVIVTGSHLEIIDGKVHRVYETTPYDLDVERKNKKAQIDSEAEAERNKYLTPGAGQAMTYQAKVEEAKRYAVEGDAGDYPFLSEEVGITASTLQGVADVIMTMHNIWLDIGRNIERARLSAKAAVDTAETIH